MGKSVRILREGDVRAALDMASCIDAVEWAFAAYSTGRAELPSVIHLDVPESGGEIHVKAGYVHGEPYYAVKATSGFYGSQPPAIDGLVLVFDARDGSPTAFLLDNGFVTDQRTGAAGGVAARHLAPERVETVAVIGTGSQVAFQLEALAVVRQGFAHVRVWGRNHEHATHRVEDLLGRPGLPEGCRYAVTETVREAVEDADVVITCTASREPLVRAEWLKRGAHVTALGSDGPEKQELEVDVLARADVLVVDSRTQCAQIGELHHGLDAEIVLSPDDAIELGEICGGLRPGRASEDQITVCDLTGVGVQDVAAANVVMRRAGHAGDVVEL